MALEAKKKNLKNFVAFEVTTINNDGLLKGVALLL
jgi:hypothetical protein